MRWWVLIYSTEDHDEDAEHLFVLVSFFALQLVGSRRNTSMEVEGSSVDTWTQNKGRITESSSWFSSNSKTMVLVNDCLHCSQFTRAQYTTSSTTI